MNKVAIVINGAGGVGKDTLCDLAAKHYGVLNISTIMPIKDIAKQCGWDGSKDNRSRKFLSDLKSLCAEYNDYPTAWAYERYESFLTSDLDILFVHIREPEEIEKFVKATNGRARTLLIRGGSRFSKFGYGNVSDDCVENYSYDYYYVNEKDLKTAEEEFTSLMAEVLKKG